MRIVLLLAFVVGVFAAHRRHIPRKNEVTSKDVGFNGCPYNNDFYYHGVISSPYYPANYPNNVKCWYYTYAEQGKVLSFNFTHFDLETCCDYVTIYDGRGDTAPVLVQIGGDGGSNSSHPTGVYYTTQRYALVTFTSDPVVTRSGFQLNYDSVSTASPCNRDVLLMINNLGSVKTEANYMKQLDFIANHLISSWTIGDDQLRVIIELQTDSDYALVYQYADMPDRASVQKTILEMSEYSSNVVNNNATDFECMFRYANGEETNPQDDGERPGISKVVIMFIAQDANDDQDFYEAQEFAHQMRDQDDVKVITVAMGSNLNVKKIGSLAYGEGFYFGADWDNLASLVDPINKAICQNAPAQCGV